MVGAGGRPLVLREVQDERRRAGRVTLRQALRQAQGERRALANGGSELLLPELRDPFGVVQVCRPDRRCGPRGQVSANAKG